ncbi:uncharacterized protein N7482_007858 [Penicillium canariense]|uniref:C2H2-type domain-containing protein n=1 Tax=Penicillium canariense TaxID=189055 RepID=A0A9W9HYX3_9EURO|nr:uncharacterized protein N7482_007858 [Penicillium canariense]KAJ5160854.1 hypothetical protein N7482_007858 [Penicillium canariense]
MYECATCSETFYLSWDCDEHMDDYDHWAECETCDRLFRSQAACNQHMNMLGHMRPKIPCESCDRAFQTQAAANQHMDALDHWKTYCKACDRHFQNENNMRMHLRSKIHRGTDVPCPFCKAGFVTASGMAHHLETGSCPKAPKLNRETILKMARHSDQHGLITNKQIGWHDEGRVEYEATSAAWNGHHWECYLCHKQLKTVTSLNQHLNSPVHQQKVYHCPNRKNCGKEFVSLAALFNHLESESCKIMRFERVQQVQRQLTDAFLNRRLLRSF